MSDGQFWMAALVGGLVCGIGLTALSPVSYRISQAVEALAELRRRQAARDAATFGEPTREQVEQPWRTSQADDLPRRGATS